MQRILVIGSPGAGKSTLAKQLAEKTGLPLVHLDKLFWKPGWHQADREMFNAQLLQQLQQPRWILDGNFNRTIPLRLQYCDTVIYLDFSRLTCLWGVICRVIRYSGRARPDMGDGCPERFDLEFLRQVWQFPEKHRQDYHSLLQKHPDVRKIVFKNRREVRTFLNSL